MFVLERFDKLSHAKACRILNCSRTKKYYRKIMPKKDAVVESAIKEVIGTSRLGRRKVVVKVKKKYPELGASQIRRVYENKGFSLYKRMKRKRLNNPANPIEIPLKPNVEWAMDFMSDALTNGRKIRTLNIVDQYNRKCLAIEIAYSMPSSKVIEIMKKTIEKHGKPKGIRTDNGPEFVSGLFQNWLEKTNIDWIKIRKGSPQENAIVERFNRTYREDILDANLLFSIDQAQELTDHWITDYNNERPHESLDNKTPNEYAA